MSSSLNPPDAQSSGPAPATPRDPQQSEDALLGALGRDPRDVAAHCHLASLRREQGRIAEALALVRRAAKLAPDTAEVAAHLGTMLIAARQPEAALAPLEQALALQPALMQARSDLGIALCALNRYEDALAQYRAAYRIDPANNSARYLEALALLALGDFTNGWRKHEARWYADLGAASRARFTGPSWLGEPSLDGRTILLHAEQGLGDTLQFLRYVPMVAALGARVFVLVPVPVAPLLAGMAGIARVIAYGEDLPDFDTHCSLMSLPRAFRTEPDTIPAERYLSADPVRVATWGNRLGIPLPGQPTQAVRRREPSMESFQGRQALEPQGRVWTSEPRRVADGHRHVALAWSGSAAAWNRSVPLDLLSPLLERTDCTFHVAQTEMADIDRAALSRWPILIDHSRDLADFADTAALLSHMDLVISVDTALVHLAGTLGRPVWTMLPLGADYRWRTTGETTPWYRTMRLFRQPSFGDWTSVVRAVARALDGPVDAHG